MPILNLSPVRYGRWISIVFNHPPTTFDDEQNIAISGNWQVGVEFTVSDDARLVTHFSRMCRAFVLLSERFSLPQLDQGLWLLLSAETEFGKYLADEAIPLSARLDCVRSMLVPFRDFVARSEVEVMENCFFMWWDLLAGAFWNTHLWRLKKDELMDAIYDDDGPADERLRTITVSINDLNTDGRAVLDAMLETLLAIAQLDDDRTVYYALHGLGHLRHPEGSAWLQGYINTHRDEFDEEGLKWLEQCRDGTVM